MQKHKMDYLDFMRQIFLKLVFHIAQGDNQLATDQNSTETSVEVVSPKVLRQAETVLLSQWVQNGNTRENQRDAPSVWLPPVSVNIFGVPHPGQSE